MERQDELDLEEILQEFSNDPHPREEVSGDTIRLDQVREAVNTAAKDLGDTTEFEPIRVEEAQEALPEPEVFPEPEVEPFSEEWEPEYDQPMGDWPRPEPIPFRPKSRFRELREKLVAGPERQYYALTEQGLGKLQLAVLGCLITFLLTAGFTVMHAVGLVGENRLRLLVFAQFLGLLLSGLLGCYRLMEGIGDLLHLRFTTGTLLVVTFVICCIDGVLCLQELRIPASAAFSLEMSMALWASYQRRSELLGQMDTLRRATDLTSVAAVPEDYEGLPGLRSGCGQVEHYMDHYDAPSGPQRVMNWYALAALAVSGGLAVLAGVRHGYSAGMQLCAGALLVSMPATAFVAMTRPGAIVEKRLHKLGAILCGWNGIKAMKHKAAYPLEDDDLFPMGSVKLNGVKFFGSREPDQVLSYATALIRANGGALVVLFTRMLASRGGFEPEVSELHCGVGGVSGEIGGETVLLGNREYMQEMGVDLSLAPEVDQAVYVTIENELCGLFVVAYSKPKSSVAGLRTLCGYKGLTPVSLCEDVMLTESFLRKKFGVNTRNMAFPGRDVRLELAQRECGEDDPVIALTTKPGLAPKAFAVTGARVLKSALRAGLAIHMAGGILGLLIMAALAWVGGMDIITASNILLYELIWMMPGILVTEWTRTL